MRININLCGNYNQSLICCLESTIIMYILTNQECVNFRFVSETYNMLLNVQNSETSLQSQDLINKFNQQPCNNKVTVAQNSIQNQLYIR